MITERLQGGKRKYETVEQLEARINRLKEFIASPQYNEGQKSILRSELAMLARKLVARKMA